MLKKILLSLLLTNLSYAADVTVSGADDASSYTIEGGLGFTDTDGAIIQIFGNTHATQPGRAALLTGTASYMSIGTRGPNSIFFFNNNINTMTMKNNGKVEYLGDSTNFNTQDISMTANTSRIKIGGGSDSDTSTGGRLLLHGIDHTLASGQAGIDAGDTNNVGSIAGASAYIYTHSQQRVYFGTDSMERWAISGGLVGDVGELYQESINGDDIVFNKSSTQVRNTVTESLAATGATQGTALALPSTINEITTASVTDLALKLPIAERGKQITIINSTSTVLTVFPDTGDQIAPKAVNIGQPMHSNINMVFLALSDSKWIILNAW